MPTPRSRLAALLCLAAALLPGASAQSYAQSFSCAISTLTLKAGDAPYQVCNITGDHHPLIPGVHNYLSMQWFTGTFGKPYGSESVLISL
jgi:hypothetical protein